MSILDRIWGKLGRYAGRHAGEECYVFGDGPSVKWFDFAHFADKPAICCNMLPFHNDFEKLDVRYCTLTTPRYFAPRFLRHRDYLIDGQAISAEYRNFVAAHRQVEFLFHVTNFPFIRGPNVNFALQHLPSAAGPLAARLNRQNVFSGAFFAALSLAYFLGFARVYLVGFDAWTIQPSRNLHWYELGEGELFEATNFAPDFLQVLKEAMEICTISIDGDSRNVTNIHYADFTGRPPRFRENHELVSERFLKVLATYPKYRIFPK